MSKISVVTVCYNAEESIEETMKSVFSQTYSDIEYIVIDGASTDNTLGVINRFSDYSFLKIVSEPDSGLYNAMNKATRMAQGDYIIFLNSGDVFCDKDVLLNIAPHLSTDIVYGNVCRKTHNGDVIEKYPGKLRVLYLLLQGRMVSHQVIFTRTEIMKEYGFDESYTITADFDFLARVVRDGCSLQYVDRDVSVMENRWGISAQKENIETMRAEDDRSLRKNFPFLYYLVIVPKIVVRLIMRIRIAE